MSIPEKYKKFVRNIKGNDYVMVDGRLLWALDEHREKGKKFEVVFENEWVRAAKELASVAKDGLPEALKQIPEGLKNILRATVISELYGTSEGSAKVGWGGTGVDSTNPFENAQTSSLGRALGFMGYGLIGGGIASYEEVKQAITEQDALDKRSPAPAPKPITESVASVTSDVTKTAENISPDGEADPATQISEGPCVDCGKGLPAPIQNYIKKHREEGPLRWAHASFPRGGQNMCKKDSTA